jgi:hypothetical protein
MGARGKAAAEKFKEGKYKDAAIDAVKGLGTTAKMYTTSLPKAAANAAINRMAFGKAENEDSYKNPVYKKKGGTVSSASKRADGCAIRGKTRA